MPPVWVTTKAWQAGLHCGLPPHARPVHARFTPGSCWDRFGGGHVSRETNPAAARVPGWMFHVKPQMALWRASGHLHVRFTAAGAGPTPGAGILPVAAAIESSPLLGLGRATLALGRGNRSA